jgi:alpha,alpha-trehalase
VLIQKPSNCSKAHKILYLAAIEAAAGGACVKVVRLFLALFLCLLVRETLSSATPDSRADAPPLDQIRSYISSGWDSLTRTITDCSTVVDPKLTQGSVLYVPADYQVPQAIQQLQTKCNIKVEHLPAVIHHPGELNPIKLEQPGLLYLENRYVVPGGRFNEMYGWDSYFIVVGLVRDGRMDLAKGMVENFFFEIEHYGTVLNANRTYYLTRSQPPFLSSMIMSVHEAQKAAGQEDSAWLAKAYNYAAKDYENWVREPHLAGNTGLSRYYDYGDGPTQESLKDETGFHRKVVNYFLLHPALDANYLILNSKEKSGESILGRKYTAQVCESATTMERPECEPAEAVSLSADYYKGDRAMRESGFDVSFRFGPYGAATHHYAPVCLNSLLYKTEKDLEEISLLLGHKEEAGKWRERARERQEKIVRYFWDAGRGLFFDYDFVAQKRSSYEYITTFYPLWAGLATKEQAQAVLHNVSVFEQPGGLVMSPRETGGQWDYPYVWAPTEFLAIQGMRRAGFAKEADRLSYQFLSDVLENFQRDGTIREKYDAVRRSSETQVSAGYHQNIIGFGWTNGVFLELLHGLPKKDADRLNSSMATTLEIKK